MSKIVAIIGLLATLSAAPALACGKSVWYPCTPSDASANSWSGGGAGANGSGPNLETFTEGEAEQYSWSKLGEHRPQAGAGSSVWLGSGAYSGGEGRGDLDLTAVAGGDGVAGAGRKVELPDWRREQNKTAEGGYEGFGAAAGEGDRLDGSASSEGGLDIATRVGGGQRPAAYVKSWENSESAMFSRGNGPTAISVQTDGETYASHKNE